MDALDRMFERKNLSKLVGCPEGKAVGFQVGWIDEEGDSSHTQVWISSEHGVFAITGSDDDAAGPVWRSDGSKLAYLQGHDGLLQVFSRDADGGNPRKLSDFPHGVVAVQQWCAKRRQLLVVAFQARPDTSKPIVSDYLPYKMDGTGYIAGEEISLYVLGEDDGSIQRVRTPGADVKEARWAPTGDQLAIVVERCGRQRHLTDLWIRSNDDAEFVQVTSQFPTVSSVAWAPDGKAVAFAGSSSEGDSRIRLQGWDLVGEKALLFSPLELASPSGLQWREDGQAVVAIEAHRSTQRIVACEREGGFSVVVDKPREIMEFWMSPDALHWICVDIRQGPRLRRDSLDGTPVEVLGDFNQGDETKRNAHWRSFTVPNGEGSTEEVEGWLLTPDGEGPHPLLVEMHGGPHSYIMVDPNVHEHWDPLLEAGWAILALNTVGSSSYSGEFGSRLIGRWGELDLPQYLSAIDQLKQEGTVSDEVVCLGHSYGGFLAAWALGEPGPWKAGIVSAGVINQISHEGTSDSGYYVGPYAMGREPSEGWEVQTRLSPLSRAPRISVPTLILQG